MTIKEAETIKLAARNHEWAITLPGRRCAISAITPCPICATLNTLAHEAAEAQLDRFASCPLWLVRAIVLARMEGVQQGRKAHYLGEASRFCLD